MPPLPRYTTTKYQVPRCNAICPASFAKQTGIQGCKLYFSPLSVTDDKQRDRNHPFSSSYSAGRGGSLGVFGCLCLGNVVLGIDPCLLAMYTSHAGCDKASECVGGLQCGVLQQPVFSFSRVCVFSLFFLFSKKRNNKSCWRSRPCRLASTGTGVKEKGEGKLP